MQPRDSIGLHTVYLEQLKEWLSNAEGPNLVEGTDTAKSVKLLGMAVSFDPVCYYPPTGSNAVVGMGLVFKLAYIPMVSFSSLLTTLMDWSVNRKERMSEACLTFLNISPESEVYPLFKDYPVLVDLISQELISSHFMRSQVTNFRAFKLPFVRGLNPRSNEWAQYVSIPRLVGTASYLLIPHHEGSLPEEGFRSSSSLCVSLATPDQDHWSIHADKKFARIVSRLAEERQQRLQEAKDKEKTEVNEERMEDQRGEEAAAAAATAVKLPNSTASAMETGGDREGPDSGAPPTHPVPTQRPLEHLMRDMGLESKDGDIIFPITPVGGPPPYDHELSAENRKRAEEAMKKIRSFHLQTIYNAGAVRQVDRILAELLMAQFTRVNQMMGADLNTSLQELFTVIESSGGILLEELKTALGSMVSNLVPYNLQRIMESHNSCLYMSVTKVLVFLDCARREGRDFLEDLIKSLQTDEELKKLLTALSKWISAFEDHVWELALSKELAEEEVALRVNLALTATRPVIGNYFNGVLEGLVGSLGIKIHEDEDPPHSTQEGLEKRLAEEFQQMSVSTPSLEGCESCGLHVGYSLEYADHKKGPSVPALSSTALPDLLDAINRLRLGMSTSSDKDQSSDEQQDLLESLLAKGVPRSSKTKDVYQKFVNILDVRPRIWDPASAPKPKVNPPVPPRQVDPPRTPATGNPTSIPGASLGSNWVLTGGTCLHHFITSPWGCQSAPTFLSVPAKNREAGPPCLTIEEAKPP